MLLDPISRLTPVRTTAQRDRDRSPHADKRDAWNALMVAAQDGHGGAYQRLLGEISAWLRRYFERRLPNGEVDDAIQETLLAIHRRRHTYDPRYPVSVWLGSIAKRKWIDKLRGMGRRPTEELPADLSVADHEASVTSATVLQQLLQELRPVQARAILLVKVQGYRRPSVALDRTFEDHHSSLSLISGVAEAPLRSPCWRA